jgi:hypothetical protein
MRKTTIVALGATIGLAFMLQACSDLGGGDQVYPETQRISRGGTDAYDRSADQSVFGKGGIDILGGGGGDGEGGGGGGSGGVAVNSFLWRASLDTVSFMPLSAADPFGGVIITDWYSPPEAPNERFKLNVFILDRQLRADGLRVAVFKEQTAGGQWAPAPLDKKTAINIENRILERARELRVASTGARG